MPRKRVDKNVQTKPSKGGIKNMTKAFAEKQKDDVEDNLLSKIVPTFENGLRKKRTFAWSEEELSEAIMDFFNYCVDNNVKPCKAGLRLFLGVSKSQYCAWQSETQKYGYVSELINLANDVMEVQYINRAEYYPTCNLFLLRTSHGHVETSKVDITSDKATTSEEISDVISKLGLDKSK